eukprot:gene4654-8601_t
MPRISTTPTNCQPLTLSSCPSPYEIQCTLQMLFN